MCEINLGNVIVDVMEVYGVKNFFKKIDFVVINGGGICVFIVKGKVICYDLILVLLFGNMIV